MLGDFIRDSVCVKKTKSCALRVRLHSHEASAWSPASTGIMVESRAYRNKYFMVDPGSTMVFKAAVHHRNQTASFCPPVATQYHWLP